MAKIESNIDKEIRLRRHVLSEFQKLNSLLHGSVSDTFDHFLSFTVNGFEVGGEGLKWWNYNKTQTQYFMDFFHTWTVSLKEMLEVKPWYDFFGEIYESEVASVRRKSGSGQFFTPQSVCEFMAAIVAATDEEHISDPCCGSGRLLLAAHADNPSAVVQAQDLDRTCVLMTICNFIAHGVRGKVIWGDSLRGDVHEAFLVNPGLGDPSSPLCFVPHCVKLQTKTE